MKESFFEKQRFTQWWIWALVGGLGVFALYVIVQHIIFKQDVGNQPMSDTGVYLLFFFIFGFIYLFYRIELRTKINDQGIQIHFFPFFKSRYLWHEIEHIELIKYRFVGYGIRLGGKYGTVYNIKGNQGFSVQLKNGAKYLIGTQQAEKVKSIVHHHLNRNNAKTLP